MWKAHALPDGTLIQCHNAHCKCSYELITVVEALALSGPESQSC